MRGEMQVARQAEDLITSIRQAVSAVVAGNGDGCAVDRAGACTQECQ